MERVVNVYKPQGMTPLQAIDAIRDRYPEYRSERMTYAGRLDPMAEGVLVILVGDAVHKKETYLRLDKEYEADIVFGIGTDTHDLLGMPIICNNIKIDSDIVRSGMEQMIGSFEYALPIYSSRPVNGKPLFQWAREGRTDEIEIPKRMMCVHAMELVEMYMIKGKELMQKIDTSIANVQGDFRQEKVLHGWNTALAGVGMDTALPALHMSINCASGTYVRTIAHELGKRLGTDATIMRLVRTRVGSYFASDAIRI